MKASLFLLIQIYCNEFHFSAIERPQILLFLCALKMARSAVSI